ncbi:hypothetical protein KBZ21_40190, partial [Streptomyces sp. A73]|nr:hypothetical protein [Streptomyces sp. A73]
SGVATIARSSPWGAEHFFDFYSLTATSSTATVSVLRSGIYPGAVVTSYAVDQVIGVRTWDAEGDRWAAVQECATAIGAECYA